MSEWMNEWINEWMNTLLLSELSTLVILIGFKLLLVLYSNYSNSTSITINLVPVLIILPVLVPSRY